MKRSPPLVFLDTNTIMRNYFSLGRVEEGAPLFSANHDGAARWFALATVAVRSDGYGFTNPSGGIECVRNRSRQNAGIL
jgi:hypothetical protein